MENYITDDSLKHIKLEMQAGVVGIAVTRVYLKETGNYKKLFDSEPGAGGHISETKVGVNRLLENDILKVNTYMDLSNLTLQQRQKAIDNIYIMYTMSGGAEGDKSFEVAPLEIDTTDPLRVLITKKIKFV